MNESIICPQCGTKIELTEAFAKQIRAQIENEFSERFAREKKSILEKASAEASEKFQLELRDLQQQVLEKNNKLKLAETKELEARQLRREMEEMRKHQEALVSEQIEKEKSKLDAKDKARELEFIKQQHAFEEREQLHKIELEKIKQEESKRTWAIATAKLQDEFKLKDADKDRQLDDLRKQIEDLQRKAEQGSQQAQGEVLEVELEKLLLATFRTDKIDPVPKGIRGADVMQHVHTQYGNFCGTILWESKRTKNWSDGWIQKLKDDMREVKANIAVIVTTAMPKELTHLGNQEGIWITDFSTAVGLATALREGLIEIAKMKTSMVGKNEKMESLYQYLSGQEFRQRIEAIVESFRAMKDDLDSEKRAMMKQWAKREKQIDRVIESTSKMYGDLQGIIGSSLQPIETLELPGARSEIE